MMTMMALQMMRLMVVSQLIVLNAILSSEMMMTLLVVEASAAVNATSYIRYTYLQYIEVALFSFSLHPKKPESVLHKRIVVVEVHTQRIVELVHI